MRAIPTSLLIGTLAGILALPETSRADGFHLSFGVRGRDGSVELGVSGGERYRDSSPSRHVRGPQRVRVPQRVWVPGHYEARVDYVRIPGQWRNDWVPPVTQRVCTWGGRIEIRVVRPGYYRQVWVPPRTEPRTVRVWVPGHWR